MKNVIRLLKKKPEDWTVSVVLGDLHAWHRDSGTRIAVYGMFVCVNGVDVGLFYSWRIGRLVRREARRRIDWNARNAISEVSDEA